MDPHLVENLTYYLAGVLTGLGLTALLEYVIFPIVIPLVVRAQRR